MNYIFNFKNPIDSHLWICSKGLGKSKITLTQFIINQDIPYEEKLAWIDFIWNGANVDE